MVRVVNSLAAAHSLLFVPGHTPERFARAASSGADAVVIDLEDAVSPKLKAAAREHAREWLRAGNRAVVRINGAGTQWHEADLTMASSMEAVVMLPKAEQAQAVADVATAVPGVIPLIETARGVVNAVELCATPQVIRAAFGSIDLAAQLGIDPAAEAALHHARATLVIAAAAAGQPAPIDGVTTAPNDDEALRADSAYARTLGFGGKLAIHPRQVPIINDSFRPTAEQIEWARGVLEAVGDGSVAVHNGQMIDRPVRLRAQAIVESAARNGAAT